MVGRAWPVTAAHIMVARKNREREREKERERESEQERESESAPVPSPFILSGPPGDGDGTTGISGQVFPSQLILSRNTLTDTPRGSVY
jgi:hypothetical protein